MKAKMEAWKGDEASCPRDIIAHVRVKELSSIPCETKLEHKAAQCGIPFFVFLFILSYLIAAVSSYHLVNSIRRQSSYPFCSLHSHAS